ncbi:hypothetical protein KAW50_05050 [candidate division WOR-3 bacterium]|nr:hypothetical protein [candidate division WOR-3 bacterium]
MAKEKKEEKKVYKRPVLFLRKSKKGEHLYAFNMEKEDGSMVLGGRVESLLLNISDVEKVISGEYESIKVSVMLQEDADEYESTKIPVMLEEDAE